MSSRQAGLCALGYAFVILAFSTAASAQTINTGSTVNASTLGTGTPAFQGGTLVVDKSGTYANNFTLELGTTNTIDAHGNAGVFSGIFADSETGTFGGLTISDTVGGGRVVLTGVNTYTGATTVNSGAAFALSGTGSITSSQAVQDNGTFDISGATSAISILSLGGAGTVVLGGQQLRLTSAVDTFTGTISGSGGLTVAGGVETLDGNNSYTGGTIISGGTLVLGNADTSGSILGNIANSGTLEFNRTDSITFGQIISGTGAVTTGSGTVTITAPQTYGGVTTISTGTLALSGNGSIANSQTVVDAGTFDISATTGASIKSLSSSGTVTLGAQTLTITQANAVFSGVIGGTGGLILSGGTQYLTGVNTYTGGTTITGGTLQLGNGGTSASIMGNIVDNGTLAFDNTGTTSFSQIVSGTGGLTLLGGTLTVTVPETYTGATTITTGTLALSGTGSVAASQGVVVNGTFDISAAGGGVSITSLSGAGLLQLGSASLTLANASGNFAGTILGTGGLTIAGGTEALSGQSVLYTGVTTISSAGTLSLLNPNALAASSIVDNAVLDISGAKSSTTPTASISIPSLSGSGSVTLGANTLVLTAPAGTFSGSISGNGGVTIAAGSETLTGQNSFGTATIASGASLLLSGGGNLAGTTVVNVNGTFDISAAGGPATAGSLGGAGTVKLGANNLTLGGGSTDFSGTISGTGGITVSGGTQTLSGSNSYTGSTTITSGGTLQLGDGGTGGSIIGNVADGGVLAFNYSAPTVFAGTISGQGAVNQAGTGTTILTAANSYTGGTTISAGTLQIGNGGTAGAITGNVTDNGTLAFNRTDATSFGGVVSGSGGIAQIGTGNLTLTGVNSYTGTTTVASGTTLTIGSSGSIAASKTVAVNGLLDVSGAATPQIASLAGAGTVSLGANTLTVTNGADSFSGAISGTGGLTVTGGTQTLSGTSSYTGPTLVSGGSLAVNGSIRQSSSVAIGSGGTLAGTGTTPGVTVASGGTLAPGVNGAGTLTVNSNVVFASGSTFLINNSSASAPNLLVTGSASLAGTLAVASTDGTYRLGQKMTVLTASGGVSGTFTAAAVPAAAATAASGAQYTSAISYDSNDVYLQIQLAKLSPALSSGASVNQQHAIGGIDAAIAAGNTLPQSFENLGILSSASLTSDAQQLAGELGSDIALADNAMFNPFLDAIFDQMTDEQQPGSTVRHARTSSGIRIWADGFIGGGVTSGDPLTYGTSKFSSHAKGFVLGADWQAGSHMTLGAALSLGSTDFHVASSLGTGHATALEAGLYGNIQFTPHIYGSFAGAFAQNSDTTDRFLTVSGTDDLTGNFKSNMFGARYESGIALPWLTPYFALEDKFVQTPAYSETASSGSSSFALQYADHTSNMPDVELGFRQRKDVAMGRNWVLTLSDRLGWDHAMWAYPSALATFVALPSSGFTTYGARPARDSALLSLGAALQNKAGLDFDLHFDSTVSKKSQAYDGIAGLRFAW